MKLATYSDGHPKTALVIESYIVDLTPDFDSVLEIIEGGEKALQKVRKLGEIKAPIARLGEVELLAPLPNLKRDIFCVGWNYLTHFEEGRGLRGDQEQDLPEYPTFFSKPTTTINGPYGIVPYDTNLSKQIDYEAELAVIIGKGGRSIPEQSALDHVFGYCVSNDITARDIQRRHGGQWLKGKGIDGSCPMGPWIVTADEIPDPQDLQIRCLVNGAEKQNANTRNMIFNVPRLIKELSWGMSLLSGDIILTGTPEGVGFGRDPQEYLKPGDEVKVIIDRIGTISNKIEVRPLTSTEVPYVA